MPGADDTERFSERYRIDADVMLTLEREALGSDYRANGYTTRTQADRMGELLGLEPGHHLLDVGAGCGWPGLYLADRHRCTVVSTDPVGEGSDAARARIAADALVGRAAVVRAGGEALPFAGSSFDAVVSVDVFC